MKIIIILLSSLFIISACKTLPSSKEAALDKKIQAEEHADTPEEIAQRAADIFSSAPGLTEDQRVKLRRLYLKTYAESWQIRREIGQMKSLLFREAAQKKSKSSEFNQLKQRIVEADQRRLSIMFAALEELQNIVGYGDDKKELYEHLRNYEIPGNALL